MAKYDNCDQYALQHFKGCHDRVRDGKSPSITWTRTKSGYIAFCKEIGCIPAGMQKPSVGRKDHDLGYEPGNIQWEEHKFNSVKRHGTKFEGETDCVVALRVYKFRKGTPEFYRHQSYAVAKRWADPKQKVKLAKAMKGNQHALGNPGYSGPHKPVSKTTRVKLAAAARKSWQIRKRAKS